MLILGLDPGLGTTGWGLIFLPARGEVAARSADGGGERPETSPKPSPPLHRFAVPLPVPGRIFL